MILVDTSVWVDHFRRSVRGLVTLLEEGLVLGHAWVEGALALGGLAHRADTLDLLQALPRAVVAGEAETVTLIRRQRLDGSGIGYVDAQLLASARLTEGTRLWTRDRRLAQAAQRLGVAHEIS